MGGRPAPGRGRDRGILVRGLVDAADVDRKHIGGIAAGILVVLLALGAVRLGAQGPRPAPTPTSPPGIVFRQMHLVEYAAGSRIWDLDATHVQYDGDGQRAVLRDIQARFYDRGKLVSRASAPEALLDTRSRDLSLVGGIQVTSADAATLVRADQVGWSAGSHALHARGAVAFRQGPTAVEAAELWADTGLRQVRLGPRVRMHLQVPSGWR